MHIVSFQSYWVGICSLPDSSAEGSAVASRNMFSMWERSLRAESAASPVFDEQVNTLLTASQTFTFACYSNLSVLLNCV